MRRPITLSVPPKAILRLAAIALSALAMLNSGPVLAAAVALWTPINEASILSSRSKSVVAQKYLTTKLDQSILMGVLANAPLEFTADARASPSIISLPMPDGSLARFSFEESPIMEPALAAKFPEIRTYRGQGIDDPTATARFDWLPTGFHAMVMSSAGTVFIDPYSKGNRSNYITYWKHDAVKSEGAFTCGVHDHEDAESPLKSLSIPTRTNATAGTALRTYRLALAATNEYAVAVGGNTIAGTLAAQVVIMNRVNGIYEREVAVRMVIVANTDLLIYAGDNTSCGGACTAVNDPYTNNSVGTMLGQNQTNIDAVIGTANYDIGHVFGTDGGGLASQGVCNSSLKAIGATGLPDPTGDTFAVDFVSHEMGHQFSAGHTFNATDTSPGICDSTTRSPTTAYEVGGGVTIMSYGGYCYDQDVIPHVADRFNIKSVEQITEFTQTGGASISSTCGTVTMTGHTPPTVTGPGNFTIPKGTPFALTATATGAVTYDWQEYDLESGLGTSAIPNNDSDGIARPLFRGYPPTASGTRTFPSLQYILDNANVPPARYAGGCSSSDGTCLTGELLPAITRTMTFQVMARNTSSGGIGGVSTASSVVNIDGASGPFALTAPNTAVTAAGGSSLTVTWNVAGSAAAPVSATNVKISLSTDGGNTFPIVLLASTPNDGSQTVTVPNIATTTARIKVEAVGNIFFDVSDANFTITASTILEVDASGALTKYDAATDGVLVVRYMFGLTGTALTDSARGGSATRDAAAIKTYLDGLGTTLDIDGDGKIDALTDGLLIVRYLLGITTGSALTNGAANPAGSRTIAGTIPQYLLTLVP